MRRVGYGQVRRFNRGEAFESAEKCSKFDRECHGSKFRLPCVGSIIALKGSLGKIELMISSSSS